MTHRCLCGRLAVQTSDNVTVTDLCCDAECRWRSQAKWRSEQRWFVRLDEWQHHNAPRSGSRFTSTAWYWLWRPLCNFVDWYWVHFFWRGGKQH